MTPPRLAACSLVLALAGCGASADLAQPPGLTLPDGDRVVRVQPGACEAECIIDDPRYESVFEVTGPERSAEQLGRELAASLAGSGWSVAADDGLEYVGGQEEYPALFRRAGERGTSSLLLLPVDPGTYGLAYDEDGADLDAG